MTLRERVEALAEELESGDGHRPASIYVPGLLWAAERLRALLSECEGGGERARSTETEGGGAQVNPPLAVRMGRAPSPSPSPSPATDPEPLTAEDYNEHAKALTPASARPPENGGPAPEEAATGTDECPRGGQHAWAGAVDNVLDANPLGFHQCVRCGEKRPDKTCAHGMDRYCPTCDRRSRAATGTPDAAQLQGDHHE